MDDPRAYGRLRTLGPLGHLAGFHKKDTILHGVFSELCGEGQSGCGCGERGFIGLGQNLKTLQHMAARALQPSLTPS